MVLSLIFWHPSLMIFNLLTVMDFRTAFTDLEPVLITWALAFVCFSFVLFIFFLAACARLSWSLSFWVTPR